MGAPPCQSFCTGGNGNGLADDRGKLIFKMNDFVDDRAGAGKSLPKFLILENSKTLGGKYKFVLETIKLRFKKQGYKVNHKVLNTATTALPMRGIGRS